MSRSRLLNVRKPTEIATDVTLYNHGKVRDDICITLKNNEYFLVKTS